jgi:hypothetical protein
VKLLGHRRSWGAAITSRSHRNAPACQSEYAIVAPVLRRRRRDFRWLLVNDSPVNYLRIVFGEAVFDANGCVTWAIVAAQLEASRILIAKISESPFWIPALG